MTSTQICILIAIIVYLVATIGIGFYFSRKGSAKDTENFYLGGRALHPIVTAMSAEASDMSSYLLLGIPGLAFISGVAEANWTIIGLALGTYLNFLFVAKKLRIYSAKINATTVPDFFAKRYQDKHNVLSLVAAIVILIFFVPYTASGFKAVGTLFDSLFGWNYHVSMIIGAAVIVGYTVLGGFLAVSTTDLIQSIVMTIALLIIIVFGISQAGGISAVVDNAKEFPGYLNVFKGYAAPEGLVSGGSAGTYGFLTIVSTLAWGLGYFGMPHILLRFMAIRNPEEVKLSRRIASVWALLSMFVAAFIGVIGLSIFKSGKLDSLFTAVDETGAIIPPEAAMAGNNSETIIIKLSELMSSHGILLAIIAGVIMAGILAATMSTADSQLLAASSSMSEDILGSFFKIKMSKKTSMLIARLTVVAIAVIAVVLAWNPNSSVFRVVSFAWAGFGAAFGPVMILSLFWKRTNFAGALAGMASGAAMVFIWKFAVRPLGVELAKQGSVALGDALNIYELLPAFIVSLIFTVVISLVTKAPEKEVVDKFEEVKQAK